MTSRARAISIGLEVLASDPVVRDIRIRGVLLRNIVPIRGLVELEALKAQGELRGLQSAIVEVLTARGLALDDTFCAALASENNEENLKALLRRAVTAATRAEILGPRD